MTDSALTSSSGIIVPDKYVQNSCFRGSVSDECNLLPKAYVFLYKFEIEHSERTLVIEDTIMERTNGDGLFRFGELKEGRYKCVVGHLGYWDTIIDTLSFIAGKILTVNFALREIKKTDYQCPEYLDYIKWSLVGNWQCRKGSTPSFVIAEEDWGYAYSVPGNNCRVIYSEPIYKIESDTLFYRAKASMPFKPVFLICAKRKSFILRDWAKRRTIYAKVY